MAEEQWQVTAHVEGVKEPFKSPWYEKDEAERQLEVLRSAQNLGGPVPVDLPWLTAPAKSIVAATIEKERALFV